MTVLPDVYPNAYTSAVVFGRGNDSKIHEKANGNGAGWGAWAALSLDVTVLDVRSDLDCAADSSDAIHLVATGSNPLGAFMHATGSGTTFNAFVREFPSQTFTTPGASIALRGDLYMLGASGPIVDDVTNGAYTEITPITDLANSLTSAIDLADVPPTGLQILAAFDSGGLLATYGKYFPTSEPPFWALEGLQPPNGTSFSFSPSVCADDGLMADSVVHVVAVASGQVWDTWTPDWGSIGFSPWERIGTQGASAPDCTMMGDETVHVVTLNSAGHILDIYGSPGSWTTTDLGTF